MNYTSTHTFCFSIFQRISKGSYGSLIFSGNIVHLAMTLFLFVASVSTSLLMVP